jgi:hypothetical protein
MNWRNSYVVGMPKDRTCSDAILSLRSRVLNLNDIHHIFSSSLCIYRYFYNLCYFVLEYVYVRKIYFGNNPFSVKVMPPCRLTGFNCVE